MEIKILLNGGFLNIYHNNNINIKNQILQELNDCYYIEPETLKIKEHKVNLFYDNDDNIAIPRFYLSRVLKVIKDSANIKFGHRLTFMVKKNDINAKMNIEVFDNKKPIIEKIKSIYFNNNDNSAKYLKGLVLDLDTGIGKTVTAAIIITEMFNRYGSNTKILYIVNDDMLQRQTFNELNKIMTINHNEANIIFTTLGGKNSKKYNQNANITIGICNSIMNKIKQDNNWMKQFGFVIIDECHLMCSKERIKVLKAIKAEYLLGLSATPNTWPKNKWLEGLIGPIINSSNIEGFLFNGIKKFNGTVKIIKYYGPSEYTQIQFNESGIPSCTLMGKMFMEDNYRNDLIIKYAIKLLKDPNQYLFVFFNRKDYANLIYDNFIKLISSNDDKYKKRIRSPVLIISGFTDEEYELAYKKSNLIITIKSIFKEGKDIPKQSAFILAESSKSGLMQLSGRILRSTGDEQIHRYIYDFVDANTFLAKHLEDRMEIYEQRKFNIKYKNHFCNY